MTGTIVDVDGYRINFTDALHAFPFDKYHKEPMKSVDVIVEFAEQYVYVEIKEFHDLDMYDIRLTDTEEEQKSRHGCFKWLKGYLKYKYRDSYLFRSAEGKIDKPIHYICLLNLDSALNQQMAKQLRAELPYGTAKGKWPNQIVKSCQVVNETIWKTNWPAWTLERI
ncbi:MAG: hypothetical protein WKF77_10930 [Planctomycetaceae bacterium]